MVSPPEATSYHAFICVSLTFWIFTVTLLPAIPSMLRASLELCAIEKLLSRCCQRGIAAITACIPAIVADYLRIADNDEILGIFSFSGGNGAIPRIAVLPERAVRILPSGIITGHIVGNVVGIGKSGLWPKRQGHDEAQPTQNSFHDSN